MPINKAITFDDAGYIGYSQEDMPDPSFMDTLGAAFRSENTIGATIANPRLDYSRDELTRIDPTYQPFDDIKGYEDYARLFDDIYNPTAAKALKQQIDQKRKDDTTLAQSGWTGTALTLGAAIIDIPTLLPGGALVRGSKLGYNALRSSAVIGGWAGVSTAAQEAALHANQPTRTKTESALAIGGSVILGGLLGAGLSKVFTKAEWKTVSKALEADVSKGRVTIDPAIKSEMNTRLVTAGVDKAEAEASSSLYGAFYSTMASRADMSVDEFARKFPLPEVRSGRFDDGIEGAVRQREALFQTRVDAKAGEFNAPDTPEFKAWFGESKVVDDAGKPVTVFHGSNAEIDAFSFGKAQDIHGRNNALGYGRGKFYLTTERRIAENYASMRGGSNVIEAYVSAKKPVSADEYQARYKRASGRELFSGYDREYTMADRDAFISQVDDELKAEGYDAVVDDLGQIAVFDPMQIKSVNNRGTFDPSDPRILYQGDTIAARGQIQFEADGKAIISLFESADKSTFLHESGHYFLSIMKRLAADKNSPFHAEYEAVKGWWRENAEDVAQEAMKSGSVKITADDVIKAIDNGTTGDSVKDRMIDVGMQEQWARAYESYLGSGKAPTKELRSVFDHFTEWLKAVYNSLTDLGVKPSPELQGVFDRMFATDDIIAMGEAGVLERMVNKAASVGAASADEFAPDISDMGVGGPKAARIVANATAAARISPGVRTMLSPSAKVREAYLKMVDNPIYTTMNMEGRTLGGDIENLVKIYNRGAYGQWKRLADNAYVDYRKSFGQGTLAAKYTPAKAGMLTKTQFMEAVARAGRRNDIDPNGNEFVTKAAQDARSRVFDPLLKMAIEEKLLPDDVKTTTAASYVTRMWNRQKLIGEEGRFRQIARKYFGEELDKAALRQEERKLGNKIVETMFVDDRYQKAFDRLNSQEERLAGRAKVREGKLGRVRAEESRRFDVLRGRAPRAVVDALRAGAENDTLVNFTKEARKAENVKRAKTPVLSILKARGGVRIGSTLEGELRNIGVTPKTVPGLFKKEGGRGSADNIIAREHDIFDNAAVDENGYVLQDDIFEAIRNEMGGNPMRSSADAAEIANSEAMSANVEEWLKSVGLPADAKISEIRARMNEVLGQEGALNEVDARITRLNSEIEAFDQATDALRNEKMVSESEAANVAKELQALEDEINASADLARTSPSIKIMVDYAKARREFGKARYEQTKVQTRIDVLKALDADGRLTRELELELIKLEKEIPEINSRVKKATEKSDKLKSMLPKQKEDLPDFISDDDRADYIDEIVTEVFNNLTGKGKGDTPEWLIPVKRGPLKERTFNIPDHLIEDFLENDMEAILRRYTRTMSAEIELTKRFGRADMKDVFESITEDYKNLRAEAATPAEKMKLDKAEEKDVKHLTAFRDMLRGTYQASDRSSGWSNITNAALTWNYMRLLGGVTLSSITDVARHPAVHGIKATMREAIPALVSGSKAIKIARQDAADLGTVAEKVLQSRLADLADLRDPYRYGNKFERFLDNAANIFTKATGIGVWTDWMNTIASVMTENRILRNALNWDAMDEYELAYMGYLGINKDMAEKIVIQFQKHGMEEDGIRGANVRDWDQTADGVGAYRALGAAMNKDVDRTIIKPGMGDKPLWMKTNTGRLIMQFKTFGLASHQRVLITGLQERPRRLLEGLVLATTVGMMVSYLKMIERLDFEKADDLLANPGKWIGDGLDRTGILFLAFEATNTLDKVGSALGGQPTSISSLISRAAGDRDHSGSVTRYASRDPLGAVLGPSAGLFSDLAAIYAATVKGERTKAATNASLRQVPGSALPLARIIMNAVVKPALQ